VDGSAVGRDGAEEVVLPDAAVIEVLPPFAGG
jgi:sulfur carrier protein ThiS